MYVKYFRILQKIRRVYVVIGFLEVSILSGAALVTRTMKIAQD